MDQGLRTVGHRAAQLDPLGSDPPGDPSLDPAGWGLTGDALARIPASVLRVSVGGERLSDVVPQLRRTYCGTIAFEVEHISSHDERAWLRQAIESGDYRAPLAGDERRGLLARLTAVEALEHSLHRAYLGQKRFSIEGLDVLVPMLDRLIELVAASGARMVEIGMTHRGRLNVLAHIVGVPYAEILAGFQRSRPTAEAEVPAEGETSGVKYHRGASGTYETAAGPVTITVSSNPSHLEAIGPVVAGRARAAQTNRSGPEPGRDTTLAVPVLIHGDASFAAQGVVAETFNLARLAGYIFVDVDNHCGGVEAIGYLIEQGPSEDCHDHRPAHVGLGGRASGGLQACAPRCGHSGSARIDRDRRCLGLSTGEVAARHLVERGSSFTAIFAQSDLLALGAISGLRASGLRVPDDVSVIGYDNPGCALRRPAADHDPATDARGWWRGCDRHRWNRATAIRRRSGAGPPAASGTFGRPWHGGAAEPDPSQKRGCSGIGCPVMVAASSRPWRRGSR